LSAQLKIEEITRMLRTGELGIPDNPDERYISHKNPAIWIFCLWFGFATCQSFLFCKSDLLLQNQFTIQRAKG